MTKFKKFEKNCEKNVQNFEKILKQFWNLRKFWKNFQKNVENRTNIFIVFRKILRK